MADIFQFPKDKVQELFSLEENDSGLTTVLKKKALLLTLPGPLSTKYFYMIYSPCYVNISPLTRRLMYGVSA
jgi:hypothetical protein